MPLTLFDVILEKNTNFQWKNAYGTNTIVVKGFSKYPARKKCMEKWGSKQFAEKIVQKIPIIVAVSENECQLIFANRESGQIDGREGIFFGKDKKSIQWCKELVDYYWIMPEIQDFVLKEQ